MGMSADFRRRMLGAIFLGISAVMLVLGLTVLKGRLHREALVYYWLACFVFVTLAMIVALLDFRAVRLKSRAEQKELIEKTLREMGRQRDAGAKDKKRNG